MARTTITALVAAFALSGCYAYAGTPGPPSPNTDVELLLSTEGQIRLRNRIGMDRRALRGLLVSDDGQTVMIEVQSTSPMEGLGGGPLFQRIDLPRADILEYRIRELSASKSVAVGAAAAGVGALVIFTTVFADRNPGSTTVTPPPPPDRVSQAIPQIPIW